MDILKTIWKKWKSVAHHIGVFQSRVILTVFYFILVLPLGIVFSYFKDYLHIKSKQSTSWIEKKVQTETMEQMDKQY